MKDLLRSKFADIKCIYSDIDGTIVNENCNISKETIEAVQRLKNQGYQFGLITGRSYYLSDYELKTLQPTMPFIGCNGSWIYDTVNKKTLLLEAIDINFVHAFIRELKKTNLSFFLYSETTIYYFIAGNPASKENLMMGMKKFSRNSSAKFVEFPDQLEETLFTHFTVYVPVEKNFKIPQNLIDLTKSYSIEIIFGVTHCFDVCNRLTSKATGLEEIVKLYNLQTKNVLVIGDSYNDIPMFKIAGVSVVMSQANDEVKKFAMTQTLHNNNDNGFANFVQNVFLSGK